RGYAGIAARYASARIASAPLRILEMARKDAVHVTDLRNAAGLAGHIVVHAGGELREVHESEEFAQVAVGERRRLLLLAPAIAAAGDLGKAEGHVEERRGCDEQPAAARPGGGRITEGRV